MIYSADCTSRWKYQRYSHLGYRKTANLRFVSTQPPLRYTTQEVPDGSGAKTAISTYEVLLSTPLQKCSALVFLKWFAACLTGKVFSLPSVQLESGSRQQSRRVQQNELEQIIF